MSDRPIGSEPIENQPSANTRSARTPSGGPLTAAPRAVSLSFRWLVPAALCGALLACAASPHAAHRPPAEDAVLIEQLPTPPAANVQPLRADQRASDQQRLARGVDALLDGRFSVRTQRLFVLDGDGDWIAVQHLVRDHVETRMDGVWLDAPTANEHVTAMVWRTGRPAGGYLALAWLQPIDNADPDDRSQVFGYFELEKRAGAPADRDNPKAGMFGGAQRP